MKNKIIEFLKVKYKERVDHAQPLISTDSETIQKQLELVDKRISNSKYIGLILTIGGMLSMIINTGSAVTVQIDAGNIFRIALGLITVISGLVYLIQGSNLKMKKVILETILFINKTNL